MIDCFDGKIVAYTAGFSPNAELANRMPEKAASTLPGNALFCFNVCSTGSAVFFRSVG